MANTFQPPPGTRDFYPEQMALRRYIEDTWRRVSLRHGFVEVDGPTFEFLDLYKIKSGDEIVSQLFHFETRQDKEGNAETFALRPEFTPTLARMIAAKANALPRPIKWFSIPRCYRAERQQKGRLKEFFQWNVDMLGGAAAGDAPDTRRQFDLEVAALCLDCLREFGLTTGDIKLLWNDRTIVEQLFALASIPVERYPFAFYLLDRIGKLAPAQRTALYAENKLGEAEKLFFEKLADKQNPLDPSFWRETGADSGAFAATIAAAQSEIDRTCLLLGLPGFAQYDPAIVRGLAYYTGFVWEISDTHGDHRAVAGGGRYDRLIEMFNGPALPATGFGMGDVVLADLLAERKLLPANPGRFAVDVFVINALPTPDEAMRLVGRLRQEKLAAVGSYKATKNIGKLLTEASGSGARLALIMAPAEFERGVVKLKNLGTREEREVSLGDVVEAVRSGR